MNNNTESDDIFSTLLTDNTYSDDNSDDNYPDIEDLENRIEELENNQNQKNNNNYSRAILIYIPGLVLAMILSYNINQSILLAILHGYLSWIYVIYNAFI